LALSLERLYGVEHLDTTSAYMVAGAGTPLAAVQDAAAQQGLSFPLDLPSRGTCTIGGNIATNAGGNRVLRRIRVDDKPVTGTKLVRHYQGVEHTVTVLADGYSWEGRPYKSLSAIARAITGVQWNGWVFFGLKSAGSGT
jgi:FAD/FMN-containing dehydrogenase